MIRARQRRTPRPPSARARAPRRVGRPPSDRSQETEQLILDAAEHTFGEVGYAGASTQHIAARAGVTKAMIHYYFGTKEKLFRAVVDRILFELIKLVQDVSTRECSRRQHLEIFLSESFDYMVRHPTVGRLTYMGSGGEGRYVEGVVNTFISPLFEQAARFFEAGMEAGEFRRVDARQLIFTVYATAMGYFADARFISLLLRDDAMAEQRLAERKQSLIDTVFATLGLTAPA